MSSWTKTRLLFLSILLIFSLIGFQIGQGSGLFWGGVIALCIISSLYFLSDYHSSNFFPGNKLEGSDPWGLIQITTLLSQKAKIPPPQIFVVPHKSLQAMSTGRSASRGKIFLTELLLEKLNQRDLKAVLSYHIANIKKQNTLAYNIASCLSAILSSTIFLRPLAWLIFRFCVPPHSYFQTDKLASSYLREPKDLANTLWKLNSYTQTHPSKFYWWLNPLFTVSPLTEKSGSRYFTIQPCVEERIKKLTGRFPI